MIEIHCIWCGGTLQKESGRRVCLGCDAEYPNIVISESVAEDGQVATEHSISIECMLVKPKVKVAPLPEARSCSADELITV
ncbi:MAG: hypothetical protein ACE5NL_00545 [Candidatus Hydrothermarchaeaceae archaeon]